MTCGSKTTMQRRMLHLSRSPRCLLAIVPRTAGAFCASLDGSMVKTTN
jgi:hypothetical protein